MNFQEDIEPDDNNLSGVLKRSSNCLKGDEKVKSSPVKIVKRAELNELNW